MNTWMRSGQSGPAHWVKLSGSLYYTVACQVTLAKALALRVETKRVPLAQSPGVTVDIPLDGEVCQTCLQKAKAQAV
jgi:hypothetical protein